jgi:peroxiredoxin
MIAGKKSIYQYALIALCFILAIEVLLLSTQNRRLKAQLSGKFDSSVAALQPGETVNAVQVQTLDGTSDVLTYKEPSSKNLLFIFSTTCPHCEKTIPAWNSIASKAVIGKCNVFGISVQDADMTLAFVRQKNIGFVTFSASKDSSFLSGYKITGVPVSILLEGKGIVKKTWTGELQQKEIDEITEMIQ